MKRKERSITRNEFNMYREWANTQNEMARAVTERDTTQVTIAFKNAAHAVAHSEPSIVEETA